MRGGVRGGLREFCTEDFLPSLFFDCTVNKMHEIYLMICKIDNYYVDVIHGHLTLIFAFIICGLYAIAGYLPGLQF